ncbi:hypothetical protein JG688_00008620 [Phytophthora aleatoria]|uniref:TFIIS N-terminal domain-containing protein n=1 Tax=Phytophthora aleatoria TaxID=2496075 RepID=A0A8J5IHW4_9STRA|nr:hypothetical protein JG688_00008620 [Phytophthora aleatoria]
MGSSDEDERKKRSINEMFGDEDSDDSGDEQLPRNSESDDEEKPAKRPASPPSKRVKKEEKRRAEGDEYDSGDEAVATKDDDDFIDGDDDLADVLGEYDQDRQQFEDERPLDGQEPTQEQKDDFFDRTLKSLKTGRSRSKLNLSPQEMEQITQEVLYRMDKAYADDLASIAERRPALEKIKFVDNALHILRKIQFQPMLLDFDLLTQIVKKWIQPLEDGALPNVGLRTKMLEMVSKMPVFKEHLKRSGLGKVVMVLMKHPQETPENKELCRSLVERWSRAVFNKTLDFSKLAELEAEKAENEIYRRRERARRQKKSKNKARAAERGGNVFNGRTADPDVKPDVSERAELPEQLHIDFLLRPQSKIDMNAMQAKKADPDSRKARLAKRMQEIARPGKKSKPKHPKNVKLDDGDVSGRVKIADKSRRVDVVSKQMRCQETAGGQARGTESSVNCGESEAVPDQVKQFGKQQSRRGRPLSKADSESAEDEEEEEEEEDLRVASRFSNQLELADSERVFPAPTSHVASLNKELKALETRYFRTRLTLEKVTEKNDQLRCQMRKVIKHNTRQEREISKLRHLIDRIQSERKQLEQQAINNRDYAKKIEHRFFMGTKGQSLVQYNLELSSRLRSLETTLKKKDDALENIQQERDEARDKLSIVQRALETRLESYALNGCLHTGLLFEISKLQDHSEALALQLAQERKLVSILRAQLKNSQKREEELEDARTVREAWVATLEKERAALDEKMAQLSGDVQTAACEKATLLRFIHEQAETKFQLEARLKDEQAQRRQESERAQHAFKLWEEEKQQLTTSVQTTRQEIEQQRDECERALVPLRELQEVNSVQQSREKELQLELERLGDARKKLEEDFLAAKDVCRELQAAVEQHEESGRQLRSEIEALEKARRELLGQLETKQSEERALREAMESALQDLAALSKQRNEAAKAMSEAVTISASSLEEQQALEHQVEAQRSQVEKLKNAKNLLQNAMLEQLAALRKQLHVERRQRIEAEARLKHVKPPVIATTQPVLPKTEADLRRAETTDWEAPQPLPSAPSPSPAPLPPYLSSSLPSVSSSSSASSSDEEDACEALDDEFSPVKPAVQVLVDDQTEPEATISLLELAGDMEE